MSGKHKAEMNIISTDAVWHQLTSPKVAELLGVDLKTGLSPDEIKQRQEKYGFNKLTPQKRINEFMRFLLQFHQPLLYILLAASVITFYLGETVDSLVIFGVVFVNAVVGYLQEAKAEKAIEALAQLVITEATVRRDGKKTRVASEDLVPGDVILLQSGDKVPADLRLFQVRNLQIDESALTGESVAVEKKEGDLQKDTTLGDRSNMAFAGTLVTYGQAAGVVCLTGDQTEIGSIAKLTSEVTNLSTPLTKKIAHFSQLLLYVILGLAVLTFIVGVSRGNSVIEMFMASVALAVGAIPEGLPAAVTITLAIGVSRMARRRAIIRKLPAVETLGSTTVICSDKTGTLTENKMTVQQIYCGNKIYEITGNDYEANGEIRSEEKTVSVASHAALNECLLAGLLCNDSQIVKKNQQVIVHGDPTEGALIVSAQKGGLNDKEVLSRLPRLDTIPFESEHQYMATLHKNAEGQPHVIYMKGSVEKILARCTRVSIDQGESNELNKDAIREVSEEMARKGLRVLAFAKGMLSNNKNNINHDDVATGLTFLGLQIMMDPPRREAVESVQNCQAAGIQVKMITGDHVLTAMAIARQIGLKGGHDANEKNFAITGKELEGLSDEELINVVDRLAVFARVVPEQKLRLVKALQARGQVVAMTGDGVNDAPALKQADIGVAMGISGTDVAKGAADMLLTDDNFSSIEAAVEEGRCIFDNLTKFIVWTLPTNAGEAMILLIAIFMGLSLPALPVQLLWINMVTAIFLGLMLVFEPKEKYLMQRPPRDPKQAILTFELMMRTGLVVLLMLIGAYWLFWHAQHAQDAILSEARTMVINLIVVVELFYLFNCRSLTQSMFTIGVFSNLWVIGGSIAMIGLQILFTYSPLMNRLFHSAPISLEAWLKITGIAVGIFMIVEFEKWIRFRFERNPIDSNRIVRIFRK